MIEIRKGDKKMEVTASAFENFYKSAGWLSSVTPLPKTNEEEEEDWDDALAEEEEKPLAQMNSTELIEKAISLGLDVGANPTKKQLREMIQNATA